MTNNTKTEKLINKLKDEFNTWILYVVILFCALFIFVTLTYQTSKLNDQRANEMIEKYPPNSFTGKTFVTETYPIMRDVVFVGDSYTHFLSLDLGFDTISFSRPGFTVEKLGDAFEEAFKTKKKYLVIFIGPNDFNSGNTPEDMYKPLRKYIYEYKYKVNGTVILCTYLPSLHTNEWEAKYPGINTIKEFNDVILSLVNERNKIYYLDLSDTANKEEYIKYTDGKVDTVHFNYDFNINFMNKLYDLMIKIIRNGH